MAEGYKGGLPTFDEWWDENEKQFTSDSCHMSEYRMAKVVWDAATEAAKAAANEKASKG